MPQRAPDDRPQDRVAAAGWLDRARYRFDRAISRGTWVVLGWLGLLTAALLVVAGLVAWLLRIGGVGRPEPLGPAEGVWQALLRALDPGTFSGDVGWAARSLSLVVTIGGIFVAGTLIGLIANGISQRVEDLRRGRSPVLETGHTVVLGWSSKVPAVVAQLVVANASRKRAAVVVLAGEDKTAMEDVLRARVGDERGTRVVCRTGDTALPEDLALVNLAGARSVVIVSGAGGDAAVVQTVLAIKAYDSALLRCPVVAEVADPDLGVALRTLTDGRVVTVNADHVLAEVTAQACRQSGLSQVYQDLLDFDGQEIYFRSVPQLRERTYGEAQLAFERVSLLGLLRDGAVRLAPSPETVLTADDELIGLAEDDSTFLFTGLRDGPVAAVPVTPAAAAAPEHVLVVGWSELGPKVVREMDEFAAPGTVVDVLVDERLVPLREVAVDGLRHCRLRATALSGGVESLADDVRGMSPQQAVVISYRGRLGTDDADARTLMTLLALRRVWPAGRGSTRIVAEVLDPATVRLVQATGVDDWVVSDDVTSAMLAQLAERAELGAVFDELFAADGALLALEPAPTYVGDAPVPFAAVVAAAAARGESALGWRSAETGQVVLNPAKSDVVRLGAEDAVLVVTDRSARRPTPVAPPRQRRPRRTATSR